jgi:chromosome segregation ATPase
MNTLIISHVISGVIYIIMLAVINAMCTDSVNHIERELVEERNLRRQIEGELEVELKKVTGLGENVEYCKEQYRTLEASLFRVLNKNEMLQTLVDGQEDTIEKLQEEIKSLNAKISKVVSSATQLVEEAEMPHLVSA